MLQALLASVASIQAQQTRMNVIGNNLANVNTTAYKSSSVSFEEMLAQTLNAATKPTATLGGKNPIQFGLGVLVGGTNVNNAQGSLSATNVPTDLAIQGNGYFMVSDNAAISYTRDGSMNLDANGDLVQNATGLKLVGWTADAFGNIDTTVPINASSTLNIPLGRQNAVQQTTSATFSGNLNASATSSDSWTTEFTVYDAAGAAHDITLQFSNRSVPPAGTAPAGAVDSWDWNAYEGSVATGTPIGSSATAGNSPLYFDANGAIVSGGTTGTVTVPPSAAGEPAFDVSLDFSGIGQLATASQVSLSSQNGFPPGSLQAFSIGADGIVTGEFTNGLTRALGQIAMANFPNPGGLENLGNNLWRGSDNSGIPVIGTASTGGRGNINAGFLEQSNVDVGSEFTNLIITQRGFQANTKVVTTVDDMLQNLLDMKR